jgi:glycine/D-amino acid oxidase-like deaminating enzyme
MKHYDYLVVGLGLAGVAFCEQLQKSHRSFVVFEDSSQQSSKVAAGLYNPTVLKRFTAAWRGPELMTKSIPMYREIEDKLQIQIDSQLSIWRKLNNVSDQNNWLVASDQPGLESFLESAIVQSSNTSVNAPFGFGVVNQTGTIDTHQLVSAYAHDLKNKGLLMETSIVYEDIVQEEVCIKYQSIRCKQIVFCEGYGVKKNPFFKYLPLKGNKGELLVIKAPNLNVDVILKAGVFVIPLGNDCYKVGATYNPVDKDSIPSAKAKEDLLDKLQKLIRTDFKVVSHVAGVRPTVVDRKPLVGQHPKHERLFILNGLGSRGVLIAPFVAQSLFENIENQTALAPEIDIHRFLDAALLS